MSWVVIALNLRSARHTLKSGQSGPLIVYWGAIFYFCLFYLFGVILRLYLRIILRIVPRILDCHVSKLIVVIDGEYALLSSLQGGIAALLLVLGHVPFWNVLLAALLAFEWADALVLPEVHLQVGPSVVFFVAPFVRAVKFVNVQVRLFVITQNPFLTKRGSATGVRAGELFYFVFLVRRYVIG